MSSQPIVEYATLSDCHTAALVDRHGSIDWLCFPRFDSPSVLGRLLDDQAGSWSIRPHGLTDVSRRYRERTLLLEATFRTATGTLQLVDALAVGSDNRGHALGHGSPLTRQITTAVGDATTATMAAMRWIEEAARAVDGRAAPDQRVA